MDNLTKAQRSDCMSKIGPKGTKPEIEVRALLRARGLRIRNNLKMLPGKPDIGVLSEHLVFFVHGCFWHKHNCKKGKSTPKTNSKFWQDKREGNKRRDGNNLRTLRKMGWRPFVVWECQLKKDFYIQEKLDKFILDQR